MLLQISSSVSPVTIPSVSSQHLHGLKIIRTDHVLQTRTVYLLPTFETSWLDKIDVYFLQENQLVNSYHVGDSLLFSERPLNHRFFVTGHSFEYGKTTVLIRVESPDPMVLPIYFMST